MPAACGSSGDTGGAMHGLDLVLTLTGSLTAALIFGYLAQRLRLSPIVGYLIAGIAVGRHTPGFVADPAMASQLSEIGLVLLMFGVGLQLHVDDLMGVRRVVIPGALIQTAASTALGVLVGRAFGWGWASAVVFGLALSMASTAVSVRVLTDNRDLHTPTGHLAIGWLVTEDLLAVAVLVLLPALVRTTLSPAAVAAALGMTLAKFALLVAIVVLVGNRAIRGLLTLVSATHSRELFTLAVLVLAVGIALGSALLFGASMALGAFLAGIVVGRTDYGLRAASDALPMRDAFAVLFFVSIGMLLDPQHLLDSAGLVLATTAVVVVGTPLAAGAAAAALGVPAPRALRLGLALGQIGEFSFIVGSAGQRLGVLDATAMNTLVAVSIASIVVNGPLHRLVPALERRIRNPRRGVPPADDGMEKAVAQPEPAHPRRHDQDAGGRAVVVGYGPTGRTLTRLLRDNGLEPTVIEMNLETVRHLRSEGLPAVYGDARYRETLIAAGLAGARHLIVTADLGDSRELIRLARELNPRVYVLARTTHLRDQQALHASGADAVFSGEGEVALSLTEAVLRRLGATPEQIERERERAHLELFG